MGLLNKTDSKFETETGTDNAGADTATTTAATSTKTEAAKTTAVAVQKTSALTVSAGMKSMEAMKDALHVDYNTLTQVIASNGNFISREDKVVMGDTIIFELLSYQDAFVVSPEDDDAPDEVVRYSSDGVVCSDGTNVQEHITWLQGNGYPKARLKQRVVVVGAVQSAAKTEAFNGTLVQFDLSPASRVLWNRYMANAAYGLSVGKFTPESVKMIKAVTNIATRGTDTFTQASFAVAG